ncbi:alpha/beta fold hydrolase [Bacillus alkalisoli]|uniref:alpha/beta fold hydrolase n=1 Tax=Bacillus alkalisoli TaxID=2011008 RepID=UPI000C2466D8|nr:alpha/beta hydrolase [Bacillus alkalisoli]
MLHYIRKGSGEPLVLIHGFLGTHEDYNKVIDKLAETNDVIAIDLPGHGKSKLPDTVHTVYNYAEEILKLLHHLNIPKATWIGQSFGGYITYAAADKYKQHLFRAAAVYSTPASDDTETKKTRELNIKVIKIEGIPSFAEARIQSYFCEQGNINDIQTAIQLAKQTSKEGAIRALISMRDRPNQTILLDTLDIPFLIIRGTRDNWDGEFKTSNPSNYVTIRDTETSHMGMLDNPNEFLDVINKWLNTKGNS